MFDNQVKSKDISDNGIHFFRRKIRFSLKKFDETDDISWGVGSIYVMSKT